MANDIITNLHPDNDPNTNLYPNIKKENIPNKSITTNNLDDDVLSLIGSLKPSGTDTSTNILAFTSNKGIYVATDNGHWYYWNGNVYADGGVYQTDLSYDELEYNKQNNKSIYTKITNSVIAGLIGTNGQTYSSGCRLEINVISGEYYYLRGRTYDPIVYPYAFTIDENNNLVTNYGINTSGNVINTIKITGNEKKLIILGGDQPYTKPFAYKITREDYKLVDDNTLYSFDVAFMKNYIVSYINPKYNNDITEYDNLIGLNGETYQGIPSRTIKVMDDDEYILSGVQHTTGIYNLYWVSDENNVILQTSNDLTDGIYNDIKIKIPKGGRLLYVAGTYSYIKKITPLYNLIYNDNRKIVFFGDSIMYGYGQGMFPYPSTTGNCSPLNAEAVVKQLTNAKVYNACLGGSSLATGSSGHPTYGSVCEMVDAMFSNDWTYIDAVVSRINQTDVTANINVFKSLDYSTIDTIIISAGYNDLVNMGFSIGTDASTTDTSTVNECDALRYIINKLHSNLPKVKIYVLGIGYFYDKKNNTYDAYSYTNIDGTTAVVWNEAIEKVCKNYGISYFNTLEKGMINKYNKETYLADDVHRTIAGYDLLGQQIVKLLLEK